MNKHPKLFLLLNIVFFVLYFLPNPVCARQWTDDFVIDAINFDNYGIEGYGGITVDNNGFPHTVYGGDHLYYSYKNASGWHREIIDTAHNTGRYSSIELDSNGFIHILYWDDENGIIKYATNLSGTWILNPLNINSKTLSMAIDPGNAIHVIHWGTDPSGIKYTTNKTGSWITEDVTDESTYASGGRVESFSITIDSTDKIHIAYIDNIPTSRVSSRKLKYATNRTGTWIIESIDNIRYHYAEFPNIIMDSLDSPNISYLYRNTCHPYSSCGGDYSFKDIRYATKESGTWSVVNIGTSNHYNSDEDTFLCGQILLVTMSINPENVIKFNYITQNIRTPSEHEPWHDIIENGIWYGSLVDNIWDVEKINNISSTGGDTQIKISFDSSPSGIPHITFFDKAAKSFQYSSNNSGTWQTNELALCEIKGKSLSSVIDKHEKIHIAYYNDPSKNLRYISNQSGVWIDSLIDDSGDVGLYKTSVLDSNGKIHISYYDEQSNNIKYATNKSGSWATQTLATIDRVYEKSAIAVDGADNIYILCFNLDNKFLECFSNRSGTMELYASIPCEVWTGSFSMLFDSSDNPHIMFNNSNGLQHAHEDSGIWDGEILYTNTNLDERDFIFLIDSRDNMHLFYSALEDSEAQLKHVFKQSGVWNEENIDTCSSSYCEYQLESGVMDRYDKIHLKFENYYGGIVYTTNSSGVWEKESILSNIGISDSDIVISPTSSEIYCIYGLDSGFGTEPDGDIKISSANITELTEDSDQDLDIDGIDLADFVKLKFTNKALPVFAEKFGTNP